MSSAIAVRMTDFRAFERLRNWCKLVGVGGSVREGKRAVAPEVDSHRGRIVNASVGPASGHDATDVDHVRIRISVRQTREIERDVLAIRVIVAPRARLLALERVVTRVRQIATQGKR